MAFRNFCLSLHLLYSKPNYFIITFYTNFSKNLKLMKISKLLVLTVLWLTAIGAKAEVPDGVWTIPEPQGLQFTDVSFDDGNRYYLYNPQAKLFFASGNDWNTRASVAAFGYEVWFTTSTEADAPEGSYQFNDNCAHPDRNLGDKDLFTDDGGSTWVDRNGQANFSWSVTKVGDCYRFQNVALIADKPEFEGKYFGWKGDGSDTRLYMITPEEGMVDWKFVTMDSYLAFTASDAYEAYKTAVACYGDAIALKAALEKAEGLGADITEQLAVYTNTASTVEELQAAKTAIQGIIDAREALKKQLDDSKSKGFTETAAFDEVYANGKATVAELKKALEDLTAAYVEWAKNNASVANPADMTAKIINPHFDNADATTGWSGTAFGRGGTVSDGAEHYSKNYDTYQTIKGLSAGVYAVGVYGYYRTGNYGGDAENHWLANDEQSKAAKLYAKVGDSYLETPIANVMSGAQAETQNQGDIASTYTDADGNEVTVYVPNTMLTADYFFHTLNVYANKLYVAVDEAGELTIGVKKESQVGGDWSMFDDFSLTYYGTGADAAKLYLDETIKNYSEMTIEDGTLYTEAYLTAYNEALKQDIGAASFAEITTALAGIEGAKKAIEKNIKLWAEWLAKVEDAKKYVVDPQYELLESIGDLADYVDESMGTYLDIKDARALNNEEIEAEIAKVQEMIDVVLEEAKRGVQPGDDVTRFLTNANFEKGVQRGVEDPNGHSGDYGTAVGWHADKYANGNFTPGPDGKDNDPTVNHCFETWHCHNFDLWQEVENVPFGVYEIEVQGYARCEASGYTRGDLAGFPECPIYLYMNSSKGRFPDVYSGEFPEDFERTVIESWSWDDVVNDIKYPNSMGAAGLCFDAGMYKVKTYGLISHEGDKMRIGVKGEMNDDWWCIFDNFKLTYRGFDAEVVKPALETALTFISIDQPMGKSHFAKAEEVVAAANAAMESGDGEAMFQALVDVYDATDAISASVSLFKKLNSAAESLQDAIGTAVASDEVVAEAQALAEQIYGGIENHTIEDAEVEDLIAAATKMQTKLGLPANMDEATDDNPIECTTAIINPAYVDGNDNGWTGGASVNATATDAEKYNTDFDYYQVLEGVPAGTYQVTVQGYYRAGTAAVDYSSYVEDPNANNNALLYAIGENDEFCAVPLKRLASEAQAYESLPDGYAWASEANLLAVPNSMQTGGDLFQTANENTGMNYYADNRVTVKVGADEKLTIGLKKETKIDSDWTLWTNWQLFYFGKNSSKTPNTGISEVGVAKAVKTEFFNLNGARINKAQKGIVIMKQTMSDGTVKVKKVNVR